MRTMLPLWGIGAKNGAKIFTKKQANKKRECKNRMKKGARQILGRTLAFFRRGLTTLFYTTFLPFLCMV